MYDLGKLSLKVAIAVLQSWVAWLKSWHRAAGDINSFAMDKVWQEKGTELVKSPPHCPGLEFPPFPLYIDGTLRWCCLSRLGRYYNEHSLKYGCWWPAICYKEQDRYIFAANQKLQNVRDPIAFHLKAIPFRRIKYWQWTGWTSKVLNV